MASSRAYLGPILSLLISGTALAEPVSQGAPNVPEFEPAFAEQTRAPAIQSGFGLAVTVLADNLDHPWGLARLPGGGYLVTERGGRLRHISATGALSAPIEGLPAIKAQRQGGLLDVKLGPTFASDRLIYWTYSKPVRGGSITAAAKGRLSEDLTRIDDATDIFRQDPPSSPAGHYGSRIVFGAQGDTFVTTGDRMQYAERAQDLAWTYGKIVRIRPDGAIRRDNPFVATEGANPAIWSLGHRNIQGAVIHPQTGQLWTIEHGPKGGDELNRIEPGTNYGWPVISYGENYNGRPVGAGITTRAGLAQPVYYWDPVIAPGDMTVYTGNLFSGWKGDFLIASLNPGGIVRLKMNGDKVVGEERLLGELGRVRDVDMDSDGSLLVLTDTGSGQVVRVRPR